MRLQNQQNMIFGWNSYGKSLNRTGNLEKNQNHIFPNLYENHSWRSPAHSEGPQTPKACFWAWFRSLKPQKHPWMARWHSNSWIVSLNISDANGTGFSGYPTRVPGRPQVVFNRFTDSYPKPRFAAPGPAWPSIGKATPNFKMLPSLEKAIIPFLRVHILSVNFHMIFIMLISNHSRWLKIFSAITCLTAKKRWFQRFRWTR